MMEPSTTYLYVSSANCDANIPGNPHADVTVQIPEDSIRCSQTEYIKLTLVQHSMINSLNNVQAGQNVITVGGQTRTLQAGNYKIMDVQKAFNALALQVSMTYLPIQNKWSYTSISQTSLTLTFSPNLAYLFGLRPTSPSFTIAAGATVTSPYTVVPMYINDLVMHMSGVLVGPPVNIGNLGPIKGTTTSQILGIIPLRAAPGHLSIYQNVNNTCQAQIYDGDVQEMSFKLTDLSGTIIQDLPEWTAIIKVDIYKRPVNDPSLSTLQSILEFTRLNFMSKALKSDARHSPVGISS